MAISIFYIYYYVTCMYYDTKFVSLNEKVLISKTKMRISRPTRNVEISLLVNYSI